MTHPPERRTPENRMVSHALWPLSTFALLKRRGGGGLAGGVGMLPVGARRLRRQVAGWGPLWRVCAIRTVVARSSRSLSAACSARVNVSAKARSSAFTSW